MSHGHLLMHVHARRLVGCVVFGVLVAWCLLCLLLVVLHVCFLGLMLTLLRLYVG